MTQDAALHDDSIKVRAYHLWEERGRPWGSPEVDWMTAEREVSAAQHAPAQEPPTVAAAKAVGSVLGSASGLMTSILDSLHAGLESLER